MKLAGCRRSLTIPKRPAGDFDGSQSSSDFSLTRAHLLWAPVSRWERGFGIVT